MQSEIGNDVNFNYQDRNGTKVQLVTEKLTGKTFYTSDYNGNIWHIVSEISGKTPNQATETMRRVIGEGYDFSHICPRGAKVKGTGSAKVGLACKGSWRHDPLNIPFLI